MCDAVFGNWELRAAASDRNALALQSNRHRNVLPRWCCLAAALFFSVAGLAHTTSLAAAQQIIQGIPRVLDGDTIVVAGIHLRLNGIDAEEVSHPAEPNGPAARAGLQAIVGVGAPVRCVLNGERTYERYVATCFNLRGHDIAAELIRQGLALDCARYSGGRYRRLEPREARLRLRQKPYCG
ncbi:thermonuclease family protein [Alsobacter sp. R-9]